MRALEPCGLVVAMGYMGMRPEEVMETVRNTDLTETCGYVVYWKLIISIIKHLLGAA